MYLNLIILKTYPSCWCLSIFWFKPATPLLTVRSGTLQMTARAELASEHRQTATATEVLTENSAFYLCP